ncbi:ISNCY family transposase, partial [Salmonella enterica subsp. enterica serovar Saintpaul]|nr:ISNCY family transposase [Salmonella enterica subsp. enterica serovar Saintpaul]
QKGFQQGRQEGRNEGKLEGKLEVARSLLKIGVPHESVLEATDLTAEDLAQLSH